MPPSTESTQTTQPSLLSSKTGTPFPPNSSASPTLCHGVKITSSISMLPKTKKCLSAPQTHPTTTIIHGETVELVDNMKYLCFTLHNKLSFTPTHHRHSLVNRDSQSSENSKPCQSNHIFSFCTVASFSQSCYIAPFAFSTCSQSPIGTNSSKFHTLPPKLLDSPTPN